VPAALGLVVIRSYLYHLPHLSISLLAWRSSRPLTCSYPEQAIYSNDSHDCHLSPGKSVSSIGVASV
jgi:hypothetical protein